MTKKQLEATPTEVLEIVSADIWTMIKLYTVKNGGALDFWVTVRNEIEAELDSRVAQGLV